MKPIQIPVPNNDQLRETLKEVVRSAVYSEAALVKKSDLMKQLTATVAAQRDQIIKGLLGVDTHWGEVRLYQTNGHVTDLQRWIQDEIGDELRVIVQTAAREAINDMDGKLRKDTITAVHKYVQGSYSDYRLQSDVNAIVQERMRGVAKEVVEELKLELVPKPEVE